MKQCAILILTLVCSINAETLYVSIKGNDSFTGTKAEPLRTVAQAVKVASPGDIILLEQGRYRETIRLSNKDNISFAAAENAEVIIDGSNKLPNQWQPWKQGIWKQSIDTDIWQLFVDDKMVYVARWPNATFEDGKIWRMMEGCRSADGGFDKHVGKGEWFGNTRFGVLYDDKFYKPDTTGFREGDSRYLVDSSISFDNQPSSLASTGKSFEGGYAVLNIGHWLTWTRPIIKHEVGSDHFNYCTNNFFARYAQFENIKHQFSSYHIIGLEALDQENEWWFDKDSQTVYYKPPQGMNPNNMNISGRVRDFGIDISKSSDISIKDINFVGAGFWVLDSKEVLVENCVFDYPAAPKFILGELDWYEISNPFKQANKMPSFFRGSENKFINNIVRYSNAPVGFDSEGMLVENCLFTDIEWQVNSNGGSGSVMIGRNGILRRNTLTRAGNSEGIRAIDKGALLELNHIYDVSNLQHDGSAINVGTTKQRGTRVSHNWVHDTNRQGVRFDYHGMGIYREDGKIHGDGVYQNNVTWNTRPNEIKGDRHLVLNNTVVSCNRYPNPFKEEVTISLQGFKALHDIEGNMNSLVRNNIGTIRNRSWNLGMFRWNKKGKDGYKIPRSDVIPGKAENNMTEPGASWKYLRDPENYDFRPKADSPLVNAGVKTTNYDLPSEDSNFNGIRYSGSAPDIGAYEHDGSFYWIPGRLEETTSTPVPKNNAENVSLDTDLMFLKAYKAKKHEVWIGNDPSKLKKIKTIDRPNENVINLPNLNSGVTYFWRVDAVNENGTVKGNLWRFTTKD